MKKNNPTASGQTGQVILILILVMTVALAIGLSVIQKSLTDVSTSTKVEESQRAFSAAEAGIEKALQVTAPIGAGTTASVSLPETGSMANVTDMGVLPATPSAGTRQDPLEYPPLSKEEVAHVWLADLNSTSNPPIAHYTQTSLDIYWGNSAQDQAALELTLVYYDATASQFKNRKWYLDQTTRTPPNNFKQVSCSGGHKLSSATYQCKVTIGAIIGADSDPALPTGLMLVRARLLYNKASQPIAFQAVGTCGKACSLPPQAREIISVGQSGQTQRTVRLFQMQKVVPPYFDYAIFSAGEIRK